MSEDRLVLIERRVSDLSGNIDRFDSKLDSIAASLNSLVRIEERQIAINERLTTGAKTMNEHADRLRLIEKEIPENLDKRLSAIEVKLPPLMEARKWMVAGLLAILALVGHALMAGVVK